MNIKKYRKKEGITQNDLASFLGVKPNTVSQWETGNREPKLGMVPKIAKILGCTVDELLKDE